ncbi:hypothetical protein [Acinetobacter baumannii]|nr:hypothetical protein [Acinetobacter baumannii]EJD6466177.1 hypothetical protein [Acinetobacter baumannii]MBW4067251.1 hypothetical protein [Acinetobacter baumannii]MBW4097675.1 hypothetical protein [Acinetobacter baumannii]MBW4109528.1 hypothetical protein [Acinetobacter baumannii]MBW4115634.1 hypothetical protein [Acinetobacter baumannii]
MMNKLKYYWEKLGHPSFTVAGVISLGVGGAFVGSYKWSVEWEKVVDAATFIAFLLTNAYLGLIFGGIIYLSSEYIRYEKTKKIENENINLKNDMAVLNDLSFAVNGYQENIQNLNNQIYKLQNDLAIGWLKHVFKLFQFNSTERVSIYFEQNEVFSLLARYSANPHYKKAHRQKFPLNEGVISQAWSYGEKVENSCPKYDDDQDGYCAYMSSTYRFKIEDLKSFYMKSCWYVAIAISKADDNLGVIVFESTDTNILTPTQVKALISYCKENQSYLAQFIEESKALEVAKRMDSARATSNTDNDFLSSLSGGTHE